MKGIDTMNEEIIVKDTFTSVELVRLINKFRVLEGKKQPLRHDNLMAVIRDEFSEEISLLKFQESTYTNTRGRQYPMFILTASQAKQVLVRESKFVRRAVIKYIESLEEKIKAVELEQKMTKEVVRQSTMYDLSQNTKGLGIKDKVNGYMTSVETMMDVMCEGESQVKH